MFEVFSCCPAEDDDVIQVSDSEGESFKTPVINSWKYAGICASPKGTLMHSYFPNGEVNAVLGMKIHLRGYGGILHPDLTSRITLLHLIGRKYPLLLTLAK